MPLSVKRINHINSALVIATFFLAYLFPFQLLFFSYAFLGPAHYLTQISWLHDRKYFTTRPIIPWLLFGMTLIGILDGSILLPLMIGLGFTLCFCCAIEVEGAKKPFILVGIVVITLIVSVLPITALFIVLLLPTIVHVFIFTGSFMLLGALNGKDRSALLTFGLFIVLGLSFFVIPEPWLAQRYDPNAFPAHYFNDVALYAAKLMGSRETTLEHLSPIFAFLSFAYTYHYLNWFSKVELIRWHQISPRRWTVIIGLYLAAIGLYLYDYTIGFKVLIYLSLLHVLLEFPLNIQTFGALLKATRRSKR